MIVKVVSRISEKFSKKRHREKSKIGTQYPFPKNSFIFFSNPFKLKLLKYWVAFHFSQIFLKFWIQLDFNINYIFIIIKKIKNVQNSNSKVIIKSFSPFNIEEYIDHSYPVFITTNNNLTIDQVGLLPGDIIMTVGSRNIKDLSVSEVRKKKS